MHKLRSDAAQLPAQPPTVLRLARLALERLRRVQRHTVTINQGAPVRGISTINQEEAALLAALKLKKPTQMRRCPGAQVPKCPSAQVPKRPSALTVVAAEVASLYRSRTYII